MSDDSELGIPAPLMARYLASLPDKEAQLRGAWEMWRQEPGMARLAELRELLHRLAGSTSMYGFDALGRELRIPLRLADGLLDEPAPDPRTEAELRASMARLLRSWAELSIRDGSVTTS